MRNFRDPMPFSPQYEFSCHRAFKYEAVDYKNGDDFPAEGVERPSTELLQKLYRQKLITVRATRDASELEPGYVQAANEAAAAVEAEKLRLAQEAQTGQEGAQDTTQEGPADAAATDTQAPADSAADQTGADATQPGDADDDDEQSGDEGQGGQSDGPVVGGEEASTAGQAANGIPTGALTRKFMGFNNGHNVIAENGVVVAEGLTKDDADAMVAAGLQA